MTAEPLRAGRPPASQRNGVSDSSAQLVLSLSPGSPRSTLPQAGSHIQEREQPTPFPPKILPAFGPLW